MRVVFVLGGPGAGKGTQCSFLVKEFDFVHLSAGDLLREERGNASSQYGELISSYIKEGKIMPVEITVNLLLNAMNKSSKSGRSSFLIDGFPRNADNIEGWERVVGDKASVLGCLYLDCPESVMESRLLERGKTSGRTDDNLESIRKRFETYVKETRPVIDAFEAKGQCWRVIADRPVEAISAELKSLVSSKLLSGVVSSTRTSTKTSNKRKGPEPRHVRVGGVPEHFNAPWHLAMRRGAFASVGAFVDWTVYPGGTGDMAKAVSERAVDVALMLTEGTVVAALKDPRIKVVGVFVSTPAVWGIHVGAASCQQAAIADMKESANFAVSRMGSGSHLMAYVLAESLGWPLDKLQFTVVGNLKGALEQLPKNGDLVFMWEKFTTLPHVVDGTLKRVGEFPTPWPFFVVAANADFLQEEGSPALLREVLKVVKAEAMRFKAGGKRTLDYIKQHHQIEHGPAQEWLPTVEWGLDGEVPLDMLRDVANVLHRVGKIDGALPSDAAIAGITAELGWASEQKRAK